MKEHRYLESKDMFEKALKIRQRILGPNNAWVGDTVMSEGDLYVQQGDLKVAEALYKKALVIYQQNIGLNSVETKTAAHKLASLLMRRRRTTIIATARSGL